MLAHMQLKFKTAELKQEEVLGDLPKAIRSSIAQHLFRRTVENVYLFNGVSDDLIIQLVIFLGVYCVMLINNTFRSNNSLTENYLSIGKDRT